ncbi:MAG: hypothetical protein NTU51_00125 [Bacteroidetes bacterium]|nr:hypothetical protein [Bacteroidota bacterium]
MKTTSLLICFVLFAFGIQAQNIKLPTNTDVKKAEQSATTEVGKTTSQANIGNLIGQLTNGISDNAFTDSFKKNKTAFVSKVNNVSDAAGASSALQTLQGGLLPTAMDAGWGKVKDKWVKDAKTANTVKTVAGVAGTLESNISGKYFKGSWATARPAWEAALSALAK